MTGATVEALDYPAEPASLFARLRDLPGAAWLDSGAPQASARYDIMVALPRQRVTWDMGRTWLQAGADEPWQPLEIDPWSVLADWLGNERAGVPGLPFSGGVLGCFGYDLGAASVLGREDERPSDGAPALSLGLYDCAVVLDHDRQAAWLAIQPGGEAVAAVLRSRLTATPPQAPSRFRAGPLREEPERAGYAAAFRAVQHYLHEGDCYQVNLARAFHCGYSGDPWDAYCRLRHWTPAPFGAWLGLPGGGYVLSLSPERFLAVTGDAIETRPIKGTRPRSADPDEDRQLAAELAGSAKDRAENVMIVDLLRNDLGRVCRAGSVQVPQLFGIESFASVHQMVSVVTGRLQPGVGALDALRACFPGGSITGAPKRRAMEIIQELEPERRGLYCGAIGYIGFDGTMDTNITIRTAVCDAHTMTYRAGGGIVVDSDEDAEYQETRDKALAFLRLAGED